jgi:hypothetical protein
MKKGIRENLACAHRHLSAVREPKRYIRLYILLYRLFLGVLK